eukprot:Gregarina_sp_Poly_1__4261@NODE_2320_length_2299_cov_744_976703_g1485_i0_p3_GENE_NODE_2320_length_2299_cov_744_976703_g1485_i0NODE_2320_length_2299_cov_744_976703_g1485_i0_p3_ORF_typecomplete_len105_score5_29Tymo_coat/PF00983_18/0_018_NODE_2320_length_2299_cov_744_976703_g1485_i018492163
MQVFSECSFAKLETGSELVSLAIQHSGTKTSATLLHGSKRERNCSQETPQQSLTTVVIFKATSQSSILTPDQNKMSPNVKSAISGNGRHRLFAQKCGFSQLDNA